MFHIWRRFAKHERTVRLSLCRSKKLNFQPMSTGLRVTGGYSQHFHDDDDAAAASVKPDNMYNTDQRETRDERKKLLIVKRKYFKPPLQPNFLTWAEKEQIRFLHSSDPGEWSSEKLAHSFPAPETVIRKVIKAKWEAGELKDIHRHDQAVEANWRALFSGDLQLESDLKTHLLKFAKREQATLAHNFMAQLESSKHSTFLSSNKAGEFSAIIESFDRVRDNKEQNRLPQVDAGKTVVSNRHSGSTTNSETYVLDDNQANKTNKHFTLEQYRQDFNLNTTNEIEKLSIAPSSNLQSHQSIEDSGSRKTKHNITLRQNEKSSVMDNESSFSSYPENIVIPNNKWKEGGTFKMGDCYYDDDGEFLYRVPGMK